MRDEDRQLETDWQRLLYKIKPRFRRKPTLQTLLFLVGLQEYGDVVRAFTKEEKQDVMHIATCILLQQRGYYRLTGIDDEGWPHFEATGKRLPIGLEAQERLLKQEMLVYFADL